MLNATVVNRLDLTKDLLFLYIKPDYIIPDFLPGQYVALGLPDVKQDGEKLKLIKRAYSIGSAPSEKGFYEFYIAIVPDGMFTPLLCQIKPGDRIFVAPKVTGTFTLKNAPQNSNLILVSTGTGIAPFMSMLRTPQTWINGRRISIVHGVRYESDLAYADELISLNKADKRLSYYPIVSRAAETWQGERGYVQRFFKEKIIKLDPSKDHVYICGNPAMIEEMQALLAEIGYTEHSKKQPGNLHLEKYW